MEKNSPFMTWKRMWLVIIFGFSLWIIFSARSALTPIIFSFVFAYATQPIVEFLHQRKIPRGFGILIVLFLFVLLLTLLFIGLTPQIRAQIQSFSNNIPQYIKILELWILKFLTKLKISSQNEIQQFLSDNLNLFASVPLKTIQASSDFLLSTTKGIFSLAMSILYIGLIPVVVFYIGRDMKEISPVCLQYVHPDYRKEVEKRLFRLDELLSAFIKGLLDCTPTPRLGSLFWCTVNICNPIKPNWYVPSAKNTWRKNWITSNRYLNFNISWWGITWLYRDTSSRTYCSNYKSWFRSSL